MRRFLLLCLSIFFFVAAPAHSETPLEISVDFPAGKDSIFGVQMYEKGVIGPSASRPDMEFPLPATITFENRSGSDYKNLAVTLKIEEPLSFLIPSPVSEAEETSRDILWETGSLSPDESKEITYFVKRPGQKELAQKEAEAKLSLIVKGTHAGEQFEIDRSYTLKIKDKSSPFLVWLITLSGSIGLILLIWLGRFRPFFARFTTAEIVTVAIFISFQVAGSIFTQILKTVGVPSIGIHTVWIFYYWILLLSLVRLVPKKGAVMLFVFGSAVILNMLLWGFNPVQILTYTICSALVLESWFMATGYGRTLFSAMGAGLLFVVYPTSFYWFFVAPVLYHHFYSGWYIQLWLVVNILTYVTAGWIGYSFSKRIVKVVH